MRVRPSGAAWQTCATSWRWISSRGSPNETRCDSGAAYDLGAWRYQDDRYEQLWRTPETDQLVELFRPDATYLPSPWARPLDGLGDIAQFWESERDSPDEEFTMSSDVVAVDADTAVVRVFVEYAGPGAERWRDLWVLRFASDGRCSSFEEWSFAPEQRDGH